MFLIKRQYKIIDRLFIIYIQDQTVRPMSRNRFHSLIPSSLRSFEVTQDIRVLYLICIDGWRRIPSIDVCRKSLRGKWRMVSSAAIADKSWELIGNGRDIANCAYRRERPLMTGKKEFLLTSELFWIFFYHVLRARVEAGRKSPNLIQQIFKIVPTMYIWMYMLDFRHRYHSSSIAINHYTTG